MQNEDNRLERLEDIVNDHESRIIRLQDAMDVLRSDVADIKADIGRVEGHLASLATKDDVINALQQTLNMLPGWVAIMLSAMGLLLGIAGIHTLF